VHESVEVSEVEQGWCGVPVVDRHLTEKLVGLSTTILKVLRHGASLDHPGKEEGERGHERREGRGRLGAQRNTRVSRNLVVMS
jgi:hypothetical protein